jgi:hypothetical protein
MSQPNPQDKQPNPLESALEGMNLRTELNTGLIILILLLAILAGYLLGYASQLNQSINECRLAAVTYINDYCTCSATKHPIGYNYTGGINWNGTT